MADGVARFPSRLCSKDGKICCYGNALSTIFVLACFCALLPTFRFRFFFSFLNFFASIPMCLSSSCPFVCAASTCYSQQVHVFYSTCSKTFCLCHLYPTPSRNYFSVLFSVALISRVAFFCCAFVPGTLALDLPILNLYVAFGFSVSMLSLIHI